MNAKWMDPTELGKRGKGTGANAARTKGEGGGGGGRGGGDTEGVWGRMREGLDDDEMHRLWAMQDRRVDEETVISEYLCSDGSKFKRV